MSLNFITIPTKRLGANITAASTSFKLSDILGWDGVALTAADFGTQAFAVFRNDSNTVMEIMEFDPATIASTNITITRRGLKFNSDTITTEVTNNKLTWIKNETLVEIGTNTPQMYQWLKNYIDGVAIAGAAEASTTVKGIVEQATQAETNAGTETGATGAKLFVSPNILLSNLGSFITIETIAGLTHSLTTTAGQRVIVWAKGDLHIGGSGSATITLQYNSVTKDTQSIDVAYAHRQAFSLMYTETPGAGTQNITVSAGDRVVIIVMKIGI